MSRTWATALSLRDARDLDVQSGTAAVPPPGDEQYDGGTGGGGTGTEQYIGRTEYGSSGGKVGGKGGPGLRYRGKGGSTTGAEKELGAVAVGAQRGRSSGSSSGSSEGEGEVRDTAHGGGRVARGGRMTHGATAAAGTAGGSTDGRGAGGGGTVSGTEGTTTGGAAPGIARTSLFGALLAEVEKPASGSGNPAPMPPPTATPELFPPSQRSPPPEGASTTETAAAGVLPTSPPPGTGGQGSSPSPATSPLAAAALLPMPPLHLARHHGGPAATNVLPVSTAPPGIPILGTAGTGRPPSAVTGITRGTDEHTGAVTGAAASKQAAPRQQTAVGQSDSGAWGGSSAWCWGEAAGLYMPPDETVGSDEAHDALMAEVAALEARLQVRMSWRCDMRVCGYLMPVFVMRVLVLGMCLEARLQLGCVCACLTGCAALKLMCLYLSL